MPLPNSLLHDRSKKEKGNHVKEEVRNSSMQKTGGDQLIPCVMPNGAIWHK